MSGEGKLLTRANELDCASELAMSLEEIRANTAAAGADRQAVLSLEAAITGLGEDVPAYDAGRPTDRHTGGGDYGSDVEFIEALIDAEDEIRDWLHTAVQLYSDVGDALGLAREDLERARLDLSAAYAMATNEPCKGCHGAKSAAIAAAEAAINDAQRRSGICEAAGDILEALTERLNVVLRHVIQVPHDLGETYELTHAFLQAGGKMPKPGRWLTGV